MARLAVAIDARAARSGAAEFDAAARRIQGSAASTTGAVGRAQRGVDSYGGAAARAREPTDRLSGAIKGLIASVGGLFVLHRATRIFTDFELTMATVRGVTRATDEQFRRLSDSAKLMGATTRFTSAQAGEGLLLLARAGFSAEEAIAALPATLNLAITGSVSMAEAAGFASNSVRQFGLQAAEAARVSDVFVRTANSANTDVRQLAEAMTLAGPVAAAFGISLEETAAAIGVLSDAGLQGSLAGTQLRGVLAALADNTPATREELRSLGLTFEQVNPATNELSVIMERLGAAGITATQSLEIFQRRQAAGALVLTQNTAKLRGLTQANRDASGAAQEMASIMQDTLHGSLLNLVSATEAWVLTQQAAASAMREIVDTATGAVRILAGLGTMVETNHDSAALLAGAIRGVATALAVLAAIKIVTWAAAAAGAVQGFVLAVETGVPALVAFKTHLIAIPWAAIAVGASALAGAIVEWAFAESVAERAARTLRERMSEVNDAIFDGVVAWDSYREAVEKGTAGTDANLKQLEARLRGIQALGKSLDDLRTPTTGRDAVTQVVQAERLTGRDLGGLRGQAEAGFDVRAKLVSILAKAEVDLTSVVKQEGLAEIRRQEAMQRSREALQDQVNALDDVKIATDDVRQQIRLLGTTDAEAAKRREDLIARTRKNAEAQGLDEEATRKAIRTAERRLDLLEDEEKALRAKEKALKDTARAEEDRIARVKDAQTTTLDLLDSYKAEFKALKEGADNLRDFEAVQKLSRIQTMLFTDASSDEYDQNLKNVQSILELIEAVVKLRKARDESEIREDAKESLKEYIESLKREALLAKEDGEARELLAATMKIEDLARAAGIELMEEEIETLKRLIKTRQDADRDRRRKATEKQFEQGLEDMDRQISLVGAPEDVRRRVEGEAQVRRFLGDDFKPDEIDAAVERYLALQDRLTETEAAWERQEEAIDQARQAAMQMGGAVSGALEEMIFNAKDAQQIFQQLVQTIARIAFQQLIGIPLQEGIADLIGPSKAVPRAEGGLVYRPEVSLLGEEGPEVVVPLSPQKKDRSLELIRSAISAQRFTLSDLAGVRRFADGGVAGGPMPSGPGGVGADGRPVYIINTFDPPSIVRAGLPSNAESIINYVAGDMSERRNTHRVQRRRGPM